MIYHTQSEHATPFTPPMQWINLEYTSVILNRCLNLYQLKETFILIKIILLPVLKHFLNMNFMLFLYWTLDSIFI
jgi:hypothetical protein